MPSVVLLPLLPESVRQAESGSLDERIWRALAADPALAGRVRRDRGAVVLSGPAGGPPPSSAKERRRWEIHVRLRLVAEFGEAAAAGAVIRWISPEECI
jgi:hypothetical protein